MTQQIAVVWNPSKTTRDVLEDGLAEAIERTGAAPVVTWWETTEEDPGQGVTAQALAAGADVVVATGGDGTVRAVAERLAEGSDADLGILPLGTGNLLARNLDVPLGDVAAAFVRVLTTEPTTIDLGWVDATVESRTVRHAFTVMAGFGVDAHMIVETDEDLKDKAGWLAYVESLGRAISASEVIDLRLVVDGELPREERAHTLLVGNCGALMGGITLMPDADLTDGRLDMLVLSAEGAVQWLDTLRSVVWDNGIKRLLTSADSAQSTRTADHGRFASLDVTLGEPRVLEVDGDEVEVTSSVRFTVQPGAIRVR